MTRDALLRRFTATRKLTEALCLPLIIEDYGIQGMDDVSPPKWHLAHVTWFLERAILKNSIKNYQEFNPSFHQLFNSYYQSLGHPFPRPERGLLSRPGVEQIYAYRHAIDEQIQTIIHNEAINPTLELDQLLELAIHHEQQHQELLLMDVKYNFSLNPLYPVYKETLPITTNETNPNTFLSFPRTVFQMGADLQLNTFCYDHELPQHETIIEAFEIADRLVTNREYLQFIDAEGYAQCGLWLSDGWDWRTKNQIDHPLYWQNKNGWKEFGFNGLNEINWAAPVAHVSFYEADAYARWKQARLPTEQEWEYAVHMTRSTPEQGNFLETGILAPCPLNQTLPTNSYQFFGDLWQWTSSAFLPYPNYRPLSGFLGEYNGKFMNNQRVLRGGSCITPQTHIRASYRNFFQPEKRWAFCGIRLARNSKEIR